MWISSSWKESFWHKMQTPLRRLSNSSGRKETAICVLPRGKNAPSLWSREIQTERKVYLRLARRAHICDRDLHELHRNDANLEDQAQELSLVEAVVSDKVRELGIFEGYPHSLWQAASSVLALALFSMTRDNAFNDHRRNASQVTPNDVVELL